MHPLNLEKKYIYIYRTEILNIEMDKNRYSEYTIRKFFSYVVHTTICIKF